MSDDDLIRRRDVIAIMYDWAERPSEMPHADVLALPAVQPDAAAIREAALREAAEIAAQEGWPSIMSDAEYKAMTGIEEGSMNCATRIEAAILALIDNPGEDTISTLYGALAQRQQPLGAEFQAAIFSDVESLYDDNPGKEVMPDAAQSPPAGHDIGPGDQAVAGAAQKGDSHE
jgi:hypothetical protein